MKWARFLGWITVVVMVVCGMTSPAFAATRGLTLAPLRSELSIAPGTSLDKTLRVRNHTEAPMKVQLSASTFKVINERYDYEFIDSEEPARWVRFAEDTITLQPGEERSIGYQVAVPLKAEPGGRYISLFVSADTKTRLQMPSRQRVASLLYVTVQGAVTRTGQFLGLDTPWLTAKSPVWSARIRNSGSTHFRSRYQITVKSLTGDVVSQQNEDALILPGTVRLVSDTVKLSWPGIYQQEYLIGLGDSPAHTERRWVIYSPIYATAGIVGLILLAATVLTHVRRRRKHHN